MGQNLQKSSSALLPVSSNISNTAVCFCKATHLSQIKRRNYGKSAFFFPFVPRLVMLETLVVCLSEKLLLMLEKSYSGQVSKLNLHKSHLFCFMCFSVFPFPILELMTDGELATALRVSPRALRDYRNEGILPYIRMKGNILYRESDVERTLRRCIRGKMTLQSG